MITFHQVLEAVCPEVKATRAGDIVGLDGSGDAYYVAFPLPITEETRHADFAMQGHVNARMGKVSNLQGAS